MKPSDVEEALESWYVESRKVFKYRGHTLYWDEYLVIRKHDANTFSVDTECSSIKLEKRFNKEDMERLLYSDTLMPLNELSAFPDYRYKKSNGCECGAWSTQNPDHHSPWCKRCKRN